MLPAIIAGIITTGIVSIVLGLELSRQILEHKLKKLTIESNMKIKLEEINAQNKLDLEKLILNEKKSFTEQDNNTHFDRFEYDGISDHKKIKV